MSLTAASLPAQLGFVGLAALGWAVAWYVEGTALKLLGWLLLVSGWVIVLAALMLLVGTGQRLGFVAAGLGVEALGLGLLGRAVAAEGAR